MTSTPRFLDMTPAQLRSAYVSWRQMEYSAAGIASSGIGHHRRAAASWGRCNRNVEMIEAIARKRGISLAGAANDPR